MKFTVAFVILSVVVAVKPNIIQRSPFSLPNRVNVPAVTGEAIKNKINKLELPSMKQLPVKPSLMMKKKPMVKIEPEQPETPTEMPTEEPEETQTDAPAPAPPTDVETPTVITNSLFKLTLTIEHPWFNDFTTKTSPKFTALSQQLDLELTSLVENVMNRSVMQRGSFQLLNVLSSTLDDFLFVTLVFEVPTGVSGTDIYDIIEGRVLVHSKIYEIGAKVLGMALYEIEVGDLQKYASHVDCEDSGEFFCGEFKLMRFV
jgi:hypothetical protein